ncbi:MAG TPA: cytidine deaminase, partial [Ruminococcaceae bacterium]|nr:cytidine deaminase [Oscillospiraceae bacterium]
ECAKAIIQCGIKEVIYISDKYGDTDLVKASKRMLNCAGVKLTHFDSEKSITIDFNSKGI